MSTSHPLLEVAAVFLRLGCLSFGGPIAHLGYFHAELVVRRRWLSDAHFADLTALCQFLPGPASSQLVYAMGQHRAGFFGAMLASLCFTLPSALLLIAFAYGVATLDLSQAGWLHGLKVAAVAVVAQAVWGMGKKLCPDRPRRALALAAGAALLVLSSSLAQVGVIVGGGLVGWWLYRGEPQTSPVDETLAARKGHRAATLALVVFGALLIVLPLLQTATPARELAVFDAFYRSGALVFGGGHVVLPLLHTEVVPHWLTDAQFLAGYGATQAVPGPLFTFAAYLGTAMHPTSWLMGLWALFAIFLPAWLLIGGALPFWDRLRQKTWAQAALSGANAAVVGVLLAALYDPVFTSAVHSSADLATALVAFHLLEHWKAPPWLVVGLCAAAGQWLL
ncbi:MAG TPA: chromate efflux transporter [Myxococcota bacterium]|nr:chromate efflux transporter [Myxococcota bacterium]